MAVSSVAVTEGSGKNLHTWQRSVSSVNREEQYVQLGEPALPTFAVTPTSMSTATANSHLLQIMSGASTYTRVYRIDIFQLASAGAATNMHLQIRRLTSAGTGGVGADVYPFDSSDTASATAMSLPSSKGTEGVNLYSGVLGMAATATGARLTLDFVEMRGKPLIIPTGATNGICIKNITAVASGTLIISAVIAETAWL